MMLSFVSFLLTGLFPFFGLDLGNKKDFFNFLRDDLNFHLFHFSFSKLFNLLYYFYRSRYKFFLYFLWLWEKIKFSININLNIFFAFKDSLHDFNIIVTEDSDVIIILIKERDMKCIWFDAKLFACKVDNSLEV